MDRFVGSIYIQSIRVLWVSEILLLGLNLFTTISEGIRIILGFRLKISG